MELSTRLHHVFEGVWIAFDAIRANKVRAGLTILGIAVGVLSTYYFAGHLRDYGVLLASLTAYGVSAVVCVAVSLLDNHRFDFTVLADRVTPFSAPDAPVVTKQGAV